MEVSQVDLVRIAVTLTALRRGKYTLEGDEVLAFAQAFSWLGDLSERVKASLTKPSIPVELDHTYTAPTKPKKGRGK